MAQTPACVWSPSPSAPGKACFSWPWEPHAGIILELAEETAKLNPPSIRGDESHLRSTL